MEFDAVMKRGERSTLKIMLAVILIMPPLSVVVNVAL
jgi:hypothetical protein